VWLRLIAVSTISRSRYNACRVLSLPTLANYAYFHLHDLLGVVDLLWDGLKYVILRLSTSI
jgi:hypothetical protein